MNENIDNTGKDALFNLTTVGTIELTEEDMAHVSGAGLGDFLRRVGAAVRDSMKYVRHNNGLASEFETRA